MVNFITLDFTIETFPPLHRYYNRYMSLVQYMYIVHVQCTCICHLYSTCTLYMYNVHVYVTCTVHAHVKYVVVVLVACNI